jgi:hypothetical protein
MKIVTADFGEMLKAFVGDLDPEISSEDRIFATRVFSGIWLSVTEKQYDN